MALLVVLFARPSVREVGEKDVGPGQLFTSTVMRAE